MVLPATDAPPPPARREHRAQREACPMGRTTSACAERTLESRASRITGAHHLRLRGENERVLRSMPVFRAPPPPARREPAPAAVPESALRTTSACAERTRPAPQAARTSPHHLRLRGENETACHSRHWSIAPPPPARRELVRQRLPGEYGRTTSACAERTARWRWRPRRPPHHLRLRGENIPAALGTRPSRAPPPPARRERRRELDDRPLVRTTSACAERTRPPESRALSCTHHLRLRGENASGPEFATRIRAPPPPARRERRHLEDGHGGQRTTSACAERTAGSTPSCAG